MGLASSVPASTPANTGIYQYSRPENPYTDKKYVDDNFLTSGNFNTYLTTDYRPFKNDVVNKIDNQEKNFNTNFDTRFITSLTGAAYVSDYNQQFRGRLSSPEYANDYNTKFDTRLLASGYNKLDNWRVAQETFTKPASTVLNTQSQSLTRLCYLNRPDGSTVDQKELCVDQSGGLYLQKLGLETDKDVYTFIAEQNNTYWTARNTFGNPSYLMPPPVTYTPTIIPATSAMSTFTTAAPTISALNGRGVSTSSTAYNVTYTDYTSSTYTATWIGTINFSNYQPSLANGFASPPANIQITGINIPNRASNSTITTTITSKTSTSFTYRIEATFLIGGAVQINSTNPGVIYFSNLATTNTIGSLSLSYSATA